MVRQEIKLARPTDRKALNRELEKAIVILMKDEGKELSVTPRTIYRWIRLWNEKSLEGFRPQKPKGR